MSASPLRRGDKPALSPALPKKAYRETPDVVKATGRLLLAVGKRVATEDPEDLRYLAVLQIRLDQAWATAVAGLRRTGYTDGQIGRELGITKQAVQQRWPR